MQTELDRINTDHDWRYNLFMQCSKGQLELLFQMEAVKNWSTLMASSRLDCADDLAIGFPPLYREHCSSSSAGYIRVASWNLNRFTLAKAKHPGFREVLCLTILRARISLLVLQEVASLDVVNVVRTHFFLFVKNGIHYVVSFMRVGDVSDFIKKAMLLIVIGGVYSVIENLPSKLMFRFSRLTSSKSGLQMYDSEQRVFVTLHL